MKQLLKTIAKRTPVSRVYRSFSSQRRMRQRIRQFWQCSSEDQKRLEFYQQFITLMWFNFTGHFAKSN